MTSKTSTLFAAARTSSDLGLAAFAAALLAAVALSAGAFLPRLESPARTTPAIDSASQPAPAYVAGAAAGAKRG